jgi:hypothetical protein
MGDNNDYVPKGIEPATNNHSQQALADCDLPKIVFHV